MERQKYKIYINGTPVFLCDRQEAAESPYQLNKNTLNTRYTGKKKMLKQYLDLLDKQNLAAVVLWFEDVEILWNDFKSCFKLQEAAGGYVLNPQNELLVFYRRGSWDMPKGKIDPGETPEVAAVREVQEETGLVNVSLGAFLCHTYHTFIQKEQRILKKTWWYHMRTTDFNLIPQTEEDISEIRWVEPKSWLAATPDIYPNIRELIETGLALDEAVS